MIGMKKIKNRNAKRPIEVISEECGQLGSSPSFTENGNDDDEDDDDGDGDGNGDGILAIACRMGKQRARIGLPDLLSPTPCHR